MNILAIDQGTSSTKALVVGADGRVASEVEIPVHPRPLPDGGVEQDPEELWESVADAGRAAIARARTRVDAVGLANQGETVLVWDQATAAPLSQAISWQDRRALAICERLRPHDERLRALTGLTLDPYFAAPKMAWLRREVTTRGVCTTTDAWLLHRLTGAFVTDAATASRTLLLDLDRVGWSAEAAALFGVDVTELPRIVSCAGVIGETTVFGAAVPVAGAIVDQQAALFAHGCWASGATKCTYGTGAFVLATTGARPPRSRAGLVSCVAWRLGDAVTYCLDGQVYTVGAAVTWLQQLGLIASAAEIDTLATATPDSHGVVFVPALAGLAAPFWRPHARGSFSGLSLATERRHLIRAAVDGIAAQVTWLVRAVADDLRQPITHLRVDGGLTRSHALMQTQADLLQAPVEVSASPHATALGVAALARLGIGAAGAPAEAVGVAAPARTYTPRMSADEAESRLRAWREAADAALPAGR